MIRFLPKLLVTSLLVSLWAGPATSLETVLRFDLGEIGAGSPQPADGLSVGGVTFGFTDGGVPSMSAEYGDPGVGSLTYVDGAVLLGPATGTLTLDFDVPTTLVAFGVALNTIGNVTTGFSVEIFDDTMTSLGSTDVDTQGLVAFSEGQFVHDGVPIASAVVTFSTTFPQIGGNREFAFDNLRYRVPDPPLVPVPTLRGPGLVVLLALLMATATRSLRGRRPRSAT